MHVSCPSCGEKIAPPPEDGREEARPRCARCGASLSGEAEKPASAPSQQAVGVSTIRAQSTRAGPLPQASEPEDEVVDRTGWKVRVRGEEGVLSFRDLESVRAWMAANPGSDVLLSSDGDEWRRIEEVLDLSTSAAAEAEVEDAPPARTAAAPPTSRRKAGPIWSVTAVVATIPMLLVLAVTAQNLAVVELSGVVPFEAVGMDRLVWSPPEEPVEITDMDRFEEAVARGSEALERGRLLDAALAFESALEWHEGREALRGLEKAYEELGDEGRLEEARARLTSLDEAKSSPPSTDTE